MGEWKSEGREGKKREAKEGTRRVRGKDKAWEVKGGRCEKGRNKDVEDKNVWKIK